MKYHIFSGLYIDGGIFQNGTGIGLWCNYDNTTDDYSVTSLLSNVIDTPNYSNNSSIGGGLLLNNELCGSAPIQVSGQNNKDTGPAQGVADGQPGGNFPSGKTRFAIGVVDLPEYVSVGGNLSPTQWNEAFTDIGYRGDGSNSTRSKLPGQVTPSADFYNVVVAANTMLGSTDNNSGGRIHWDVAIGTLGQFLLKIKPKIGTISGPGFGTVTPSTPDELAAGLLLVSGYGILRNDTLAFNEAPAPA